MNVIEVDLYRAWLNRHPAAAVNHLAHSDLETRRALVPHLDTTELATLVTLGSAWWMRTLVDEYPTANWPGAIARAGADPNVVRLLRLFDPVTRTGMMRDLPARRRHQLQRALMMPVDQVVSVTEGNVPTAQSEDTVADALRRMASGQSSGAMLYLTGENDRYLGQIEITSLLAADPTALLSSLPMRRHSPLRGAALISDAIDDEHWRGIDVLPVVDRLDKFVGAVRFSAVYRAVQRQTENARSSPQSLAAAIIDGWLDVLRATIAPPDSAQRSSNDHITTDR